MVTAAARWLLRHSPSRRLGTRLALKYRRLLPIAVQWTECEVDDIHFRLRVDTAEVHGYLLRMMGIVEPIESFVVRRLAHSGWAMLDVGANIGYYSVLAASACPSGQVWSFEPTPDTFATLEENVLANNLTNVHLSQIALGDSQGTLTLDVYADKAFNSIHTRHDPQHPFFPGGPVAAVQVPTTTLDAFLSAHGLAHVDLVKLDVEGYEWSVLHGASGMLSGPNAPVLMCEIEPLWLQRFGVTFESLIRYLKGFGYEAFALRGSGVYEETDPGFTRTDSFVFVKSASHEEVLTILRAYFSGIEGVKARAKRGLVILGEWLGHE